MARIYGEITASALMTFDKSFSRSNGQPLDSTEVFYSLTAAQDYAKTDVAYVSQKIAVVETVDDVTTVTHYSIEADGSLKELGAVAVGDGVTVEVVDGKIQLVGLDAVTDTSKKYQPVLVDGKLTWQELSTTTVEGLDASVKAVEGEVDALQASVGEVPEDTTVVEMIAEATYDDTQVKADIQANADAITAENTRAEGVESELRTDIDAIKDDYLKEADKEALQSQIDTIMNNPDTEGVINSINEFTQYIADHGEIAEGFRTDIDKNKEDIAANAQAIADKEAADAETYETKTDASQKLDEAKAYADTAEADAIATANAYTDAQNEVIQGNIDNVQADVDDLAAIGAEKNIIAAVDETQFVIDDNRQLALLDIAMSKVSGLTDALANKVDKVEGSRLITENEAEKLEKLVLSDDGSVSVSGTIAAGNVDGLADWITARAGTLEGLTENNLTDALLEKINGVEAGAEVNLIDVIQVNGVALDITAKTVNIKTSDIVKASDEVTVAEDGTLGIGSISTDKLVQGTDVLILNGGSAQ